MSLNTKIRKRVSFTPIMLTSKSIRPVDRSDYQLMRNQRKISKLRKTRDDFSNFVFRQSQHFERLDSPSMHNQDHSDYELLPAERRSQDESYRQMMRKMTTPAVVKVEFQRENSKNRHKVDERAKELREIEANQDTKKDFKRLLNLTNAKTFEEFTKMSKINPSKRLAHRNAEDVESQWKKYLDKYYLNIKKVRPMLKKEVFDLLSVQKILQGTETHENSEKRRDSPQKLLIRFKSNSPFRSRSKCQTRLQQQQKASNDSTERNTDLITTVVLKKIEHDILNRKSLHHKKEFFVFGLNQTSNKPSELQVKAKFEIYKDFLFRVNYTNDLYVSSKEETERPLKFYVGFGNNSAIIKGIMRRRFWWQITDKIAEDTNFIWTQLKITEFFKGQVRNRYKPRQIAKEKNSFFEQSSKSSQSQMGTRPIMKGQDLKIWQRYYQKNARYQQKGFENALLKRVGSLLKNKKMKIIQSPLKIKVQNHFQANYFLGNKKALFYSLRKYYQLLGIDPFTKVPLTFHVTEGLTDPQFQRFLDQFQAQNNKKKTDKQFRNIWIVKPGELTNRGRGITVCSTLDEIKIRLKAKQRNSNGTARTFIIQKYIQKPLLYQRRKFDIRHYMAITCVNGKMKGYWYAQGYIRTTSSEYNIKNTKDLFTHLTNDAVQKNGQDYGKFQKGNKVSYAEFQKYLTHSLGLDVDFNGQILTRMKELATDSIKATYSLLDPERKQHNFELFGLDFMLDQELNVYLIEVNTNPCLQTSCPLLTKIITPLVQNLFKLCLDPIFPPPVQWPSQKKYYLGQNAFEENKFSLVFDEADEGVKLQELYKNAQKVDARMGDIFEQDEQYCDEQKEWNDDQQAKK